MNPRFHKDVIAKVKQSIQRISQSRLRRTRTVDSLVKMNIPPLAGRRDATASRAEAILAEKLSDGSLQERAKLCALAVRLLDNAIKDSMTIVGATVGDKYREHEKDVADFLRLLRNSVQAVLDAVNFELAQNQEANEPDASIPSRIDNHDLSIKAESLIEYVKELLEATCERRADYRHRTVKSFDRNDADRYHAAFKSYSAE